MQSVVITTKVSSWNPAHGGVYSIHYVIKLSVTCGRSPEFSDILWHPTKIDGPKVFLLTKINPEFSDILSNPTHFLVPWCVALDRFHCIYIILVFNIYIGHIMLYLVHFAMNRVWTHNFSLTLASADILKYYMRGRHGHDHMVVEFTTTCAISAYHH
jgi:hypothetical protein